MRLGLEKSYREIQKFKKFQRIVLGSKEKIEVKEADIRNYTIYSPRGSGSREERVIGMFKIKDTTHE